MPRTALERALSRCLIVAGLSLLAVSASPAAGERDLTPQARRMVRLPSFLEEHGLKPGAPPARPALPPDDAARAALARLTAVGWHADWDIERGTPILLTGGAAGPYPGTAEEAARAFLREHADLFRIPRSAELRHWDTITSRGGAHVSFVQHHRGLPVYRGVVLVGVDGEGYVRMASGGFFPVPARTPHVRRSADEVVEQVLQRLDPRAALVREVAAVAPPAGLPGDGVLEYGRDDVVPYGTLRSARARASWYPAADGFRIAWMVDVAPGENVREFRTFVDAADGSLLYSEMLTMETHETIRVYPVNPQLSSLSDEPIRDVDKPVTGGQLNGAFTNVTNGQATRISGPPYNHSTDPDDPTVDLNFDEQNVFYHNNLIRQYFRDLNGDPNLGINIDTNKLDSQVHLVDGGNPDADNAFYSPQFDQTLFGHGSFHTGAVLGLRDFALEDSVVYHEYSHRINDNVAGFGGNIYGGAANEGTADYWAASFANDKYIGEFANADPEVGDDSGYIGLYGFVRSMENARTYSDVCDNPFTPAFGGACSGGTEVHSDGEIYGGVLWDLRKRLVANLGPAQGVQVADSLVLEHLFNMTGGGPFDTDDFIEGRNALLTASSTLYASAYECEIWKAFAGRRIGDGANNAVPPGTSTALPAACAGAADASFSKGAYSCADPDAGSIAIVDPDGGAVTTVTVTTDSGDSETFSLSWAGTLATTPAFDVRVIAPTPGNGVVEVSAEGERILATYADDSPAKPVNAASTVDCSPDLRFAGSRVFNGSCDADDPFLDGGETARIGVTLRNHQLNATLELVELTLVSANPNVTVDVPQTRAMPALVPGGDIEVFWAITGASGVSPGETVDFTVLVGGPGLTGSEGAIAFTETLEQDVQMVPQMVSWDFSANNGGFDTFANGTGTNAWRYQTAACASPPTPGYWHQGRTGSCQTYDVTDSAWLATPFLRMHPYDSKHQARLTSLRFKHRLDFNAKSASAPFIEGDLFALTDNLQQISFYDSADNGGAFVQEEIDFTGGLPPGLDLTHGWVRFSWLFIADTTGEGGGINNQGWYIDDVEIHYESPSEIADGNAPAACAPAVSLVAAGAGFADPAPSQGNGDGVVDPGEVVTVSPVLQNAGTGTADAIVGHLSSDRPDIITIVDGTASFPNILALESETPVAPAFTIAVDPSAACNTIVTFTLTVDHNGAAGASVTNFLMRVGQLVAAGSPTFFDDFEADSGVWTVNPNLTDTATAGAWQRVNPTRNCYTDNCANNETQPGDDYDPGTSTGQCYITQNGGAPFSAHDVDGGHTTVESSVVDLSGQVDPSVSYARYVYNRDGHAGDGFFFEVSNDGGSTWTTVESVTDANGIPNVPVTNFWIPAAFLISDHLPVTDQMRFRFRAADEPVGATPGQIVEAAFDAFEIRDNLPVCNLFVPPAPPEVSPPGALVPFTVDRTTPGTLDLAWETTAGATSYRVVAGSLTDLLSSGGVTATNTTPVACGIAGTSTSVPEPGGAVHLLVVGESVGGVGPAGSASGGAPRTVGTTCP